MGIAAGQPWAASTEELKWCFSDHTFRDHTAAQLEDMTECSDESLHLYIHRYSNMHYAATNKTKQAITDLPTSFRFLASINNTAI